MPTGTTELRIQEITKVLKEQVCDVADKKFLPRHLDLTQSKTKDSSSTNLIEITRGEITANTLLPREQEKQSEYKPLTLTFFFPTNFL